ncbi:MAG TPA: P-loop NTPase, partial [Actinomycetes bacterium]|nr:P-loop NTPase [Actinomycetes bacterium]
MTAGVGAEWEAALVRACEAGQVGAQVLHRCYDLSDLLAVAAAGQAEVAVVAAGTRWLDRDALARLAAAGLAVVGVVAAGDEDSERRLRQLGLLHVASDADPPDALVDRARAALAAEPDPAEIDPADEPPEVGDAPIEPDGEGRRILAAVWGPKGGPGRTTVAVNLAFEAAAAGGEVLLVDADTYGGAVAQTLGFLDDAPGLAWAARVAGRGELDVLRLRQSVRRAAPGGPRVLPGLPRAELWTEVRPGTWEALLELFRTSFPVTVVDIGFCLEEDEELLYDQVRLRRNAVTRLAVQTADLVVAVARADPVGLHAFIRGYQELRDLGVPASRVRVVVNQLRPGMFGGDRPAEQVRAALSRYVGIEPSAVVPYDRQGVDAALLAGQALREARPGSPAQLALARLAAVLFPAQAVQTRRARRRSRVSGPAAAAIGS